MDHPDDGDWSVSGMMVDRSTDEQTEFAVQLAFLSIGSSIAESIETAPASTRDAMDRYVARHVRSMPSFKHAAEHLKTLFALQPYVTRDKAAIEERRGGCGFHDLVGFFAELAGIMDQDSTAKVAIVSGRTCFHLGYPYVLTRPNANFDVRNFWLNEQNSDMTPPDPTTIVELPAPFSGTLVTMSFRLDRDYLESSLDA